jgi:hypothetical protein
MVSRCGATIVFFYAVRRFRRERDYLVVTWSQWGWLCHFAWTAGPGQPVYAYMPLAPRRYRFLPPLLFQGREEIVHPGTLPADERH